MPPETQRTRREERLEAMQLVFVSSGPSDVAETAYTHMHTLVLQTVPEMDDELGTQCGTSVIPRNTHFVMWSDLICGRGVVEWG